MYILVLDTAAKRLSVSLVEIQTGASIGSFVEKEEENSHARKVNLVIQDLLSNAQVLRSQLSAVAINEGPGSFTGLRVGSSTAKGLCFALDIPLITLCGLAEYGKYLYGKKAEDVTDVFILMDARRGNYFYSHISQNKQESVAQFKHISDIETDVYLSRKPWIVYLERESTIQLSANELIQSAVEKWSKKEFTDIRKFEPQYIVNNYIVKNDI